MQGAKFYSSNRVYDSSLPAGLLGDLMAVFTGQCCTGLHQMNSQEAELPLPKNLYDIDPLLPLVQQGFILLTPNFRLARRIKAEWDARHTAGGERTWEPLPVYPLEGWLVDQWRYAVSLELTPPAALLGQAQQLLMWQQVITEDENRHQQYHLLRPAAAAELASQARENAALWCLDMGSESVRQRFTLDEDCATYLRWHARFQQRLDALQAATTADCVNRLLACAESLPSCGAVLLEFDDISPLYRAALGALTDQVVEHQPTGEPGHCVSHVFTDRRAELRAVAHWAHNTSQREPQASLGIMLSDTGADRVALEYLLRVEFGCLGENYNALPVNFSTGIGLDRAPVVRDALGALAMGLREVTVPEVVRLLQSRFLHLPDTATALANKFLNGLFDEGREVIESAELRYLAGQAKLGESRGLELGRHLLAVSAMRDLRRPALPSVWIARFSQVLDQWGWPGPGPLDSLEYQQVELWYRTLDEFSAYDAVSEAIDYEAALALLRQSCSAQVSQPRTEDSRIQVLGPLEAAGLAFDHLWLSGMQGSSWPCAARPNPFVPLSLQRERQMPHATAAREWAFSANLVRQYTHCANLVHASYCEQLDGIPELPSAFLEDFTAQAGEALPGVNAAWTAQWRIRELEYLQDHEAPPATDSELRMLRGGSGLLEDQSHCPFRAFARRRLRVQPLSDFGVALSAAERGSLLHDALYVLWGDLSDHQTLLGLDQEGERLRVEAAVHSAITAIPGGRRRILGDAYWSLEAKRLSALLREWLAVERTRGEFVVYQREKDVALQLQRLQISLRVDRIDVLPDGSRVIIDYKSGLSKVQDWLGERPAKPQLLLYGIAAPEETAALTFAQLRPRDSRFVGIGSVQGIPGVRTDIAKLAQERMSADDWASLNERWRDNLARLADDFVAGRAAVDPLAPDSCTWCGLQPLCRIGLDSEEHV